jgi:predicted Zn-dependent protease
VGDLLTRSGRAVVAAAVAALLAAGCGEEGFQYGVGGEGPGQRRQEVALSAQQEVDLGNQAFKEVLAKEQSVKDPELARVREVGEKIFAVALGDQLESRLLRQEIGIRERDPYGSPYDFSRRDYAVLSDDSVNAFCLPGGKVAVFTGLLDMIKKDPEGSKHEKDWLATVLGHEIAHALAHHASERIAYEQMYGPASQATAGLARVAPDDRLKLLDLAGVGRHALKYADQRPDSRQPEPGMFAQVRELAFDRQQEEEADHIGVFLMAFAGYDPAQAVAFWQAMAERGAGKGVPEILSDHPTDAHRIQLMQRWAVRAQDALNAWKAGRVARPAGG